MQSRFLVLMQREWLQHRMGWLVLLIAPTLLLGALTFFDGSIQFDVNTQGARLHAGSTLEGEVAVARLPPLLQAGSMTTVVIIATVGLTLLTVLFQLPGLARRDQQDRTIEFWGSLPVGHAQSVAAPLLTHLVALPWAALLAGVVGAQLVTLVLVSFSHGPMAWLSLPWGTLLPALAMLVLRLSLGLLMALAWMSPLLLLTQVASVGLRRWGVPAVGAAVLAGIKLLDPRLPQPIVTPALHTLTTEALYALVYVEPLGQIDPSRPGDLPQKLADLPAELWHNCGQVLASAATPGFALALAVAAGAFCALVWLRRQRM